MGVRGGVGAGARRGVGERLVGRWLKFAEFSEVGVERETKK